MTLYHSGDWQCDLNNLDRCQIFVDQLVEELEKSNRTDSTFFVHGGDIKERFNPMDIRVMNFLIESFRRIKKACSGYYFVEGNHDPITTQDGVQSCTPLIDIIGANAVAYRNWVQIPIRMKSWNTVARYCLLYLVPFARNPETQQRMFTEASERAAQHSFTDFGVTTKKVTQILFFHNTITGCKQNLYTTGEGFSIDDIGAKYYDLCIGSHVHMPQKIGRNIYITGSPFAMDWNEINQDHRFLKITIGE